MESGVLKSSLKLRTFFHRGVMCLVACLIVQLLQLLLFRQSALEAHSFIISEFSVAEWDIGFALSVLSFLFRDFVMLVAFSLLFVAVPRKLTFPMMLLLFSSVTFYVHFATAIEDAELFRLASRVLAVLLLAVSLSFAFTQKNQSHKWSSMGGMGLLFFIVLVQFVSRQTSRFENSALQTSEENDQGARAYDHIVLVVPNLSGQIFNELKQKFGKRDQAWLNSASRSQLHFPSLPLALPMRTELLTSSFAHSLGAVSNSSFIVLEGERDEGALSSESRVQLKGFRSEFEINWLWRRTVSGSKLYSESLKQAWLESSPVMSSFLAFMKEALADMSLVFSTKPLDPFDRLSAEMLSQKPLEKESTDSENLSDSRFFNETLLIELPNFPKGATKNQLEYFDRLRELSLGLSEQSSNALRGLSIVSLPQEQSLALETQIAKPRSSQIAGVVLVWDYSEDLSDGKNRVQGKAQSLEGVLTKDVMAFVRNTESHTRDSNESWDKPTPFFMRLPTDSAMELGQKSWQKTKHLIYGHSQNVLSEDSKGKPENREGQLSLWVESQNIVPHLASDSQGEHGKSVNSFIKIEEGMRLKRSQASLRVLKQLGLQHLPIEDHYVILRPNSSLLLER